MVKDGDMSQPQDEKLTPEEVRELEEDARRNVERTLAELDRLGTREAVAPRLVDAVGD
jgi:hypothetical protein